MAGDTFEIIEFNNNTAPYISDTNLRLMQTRIDGGIKNVDDKVEALQEQKSVQLSTAGWYRVAKINGTGHPAKTLLLSISTQYNNSESSSTLVSIITTWLRAKITQINAIKCTEDGTIQKVRVLYDETNQCFYVDAYYSVNAVNDLVVKNENLIQNNDIEILTPTAETLTTNVKNQISITYGKIEPYYENLNNYFINSWSSNGLSIIEVDEIGVKHITVSCRNGTNVNFMQLPEEFRPTSTVLLNASNFTAVGYVTINTSGVVSVSNNIFTSGSSNLVFSGVYR